MSAATPGHSRRSRGKAPDPLKAAIDRARDDSSAFVTLAARFVPYRSFWEECGVDEFRLVLGLAIFDTFAAGMKEEDKARRLAVRPVARLPEYRTLAGKKSGAPLYDQIQRALMDKASELSIELTMDALAEKIEDLAARDLATIAVTAPTNRERLQATTEIIDRRSAKRGRDVAPTVLIVPERLGVELQAGFQYLAGMIHGQQVIGASEGEIDAGALNVPKLIGAGDTGKSGDS